MRQEVKKITQKDQLAIVLTHPGFMVGGQLIELHAVKRYIKVTQEGDPELFFDAVVPVEENENDKHELETVPEVIQEMLKAWGSFGADKIALAQGVVTLDDDNEPLPEHLPTPTDHVDGVFEKNGAIMASAIKKRQM